LHREAERGQIVQDELERKWSPEQIAAHLREPHPDWSEWHLRHEIIYQGSIAAQRRPGRDVVQKLHTRRLLRQHRRSPLPHRPRFIAAGRLIDQRSAVVEHRARIGNREGDLIIGRMSRLFAAVVTAVGAQLAQTTT
jgi:IS30 family transposase